MGDESGEKKGGFFRKLFKITAILAAIGAAVMFWKPGYPRRGLPVRRWLTARGL